MIRYLKSIFQHRCPTCNEPLHSHIDELRCEKICPNGHYKEETFGHLGIRIIYEDVK
ncbi:MAG: hypothetical protein K0R47_3030 [Brevibacillus sp.]|nr:hypothetical protein [Brevibacillus sp.]